MNTYVMVVRMMMVMRVIIWRLEQVVAAVRPIVGHHGARMLERRRLDHHVVQEFL